MPDRLQVLHIEDNPADIDLTRKALLKSKLRIKLHIVDDGDDALDFLHQRGQYADAPRPDLVLLDLNMPKRDGRDLLAEMKGDASLKKIPVVILTSSAAEIDIAKSYALGANCYVTKPVGLREFQEIVSKIEEFWFTIVRLPPAEGTL